MVQYTVELAFQSSQLDTLGVFGCFLGALKFTRRALEIFQVKNVQVESSKLKVSFPPNSNDAANDVRPLTNLRVLRPDGLCRHH